VSLAANLTLGVAGAAALGGAFAVGWIAPDPPGDDALTVVRRAPPPAAAPPLAPPGANQAADVARLAAVLPAFGEPAPAAPPTTVVVRRPVRAPPPGPTVMAAAPMHDAGLDFRRQASAIVRLRDQSLAVLLAAAPGRPSRLLRVGEAFDGRWRLAALSMDAAVLGDGVTQERVPLFGNPAGGPSAAPAPGRSPPGDPQ
jgi:hypothetical protein